MISRAIIAALLLISSTVSGHTRWPEQPYVEARAYAYNSRGDIGRPIVQGGRLDRSAVNKRGIALTPEQTARLVAAVTGKHRAPEEWMACFSPRHGIVFYNAARKPVAWVSLCFECDNAEAEPDPKTKIFDIRALEALATELRLPMVPR
ncbi:MAG: hypothetical protein EOP84_10390 [Verrucomicrobiaceae bacterium]|nr:MAG: hypothetical protein EOP84_10390 [Verrucomicrobiaceae bacterium]